MSKRRKHSADSAQSRVWAEPTPLDPPRVPAPFPVDVLPAVLADYARALSEATQTPLDLPGVTVLGVVSTAACGRVVVEARPGWREPVNLYLVAVLPPGARKSAVVAAATDVLYVVEQEISTRARGEIADLEVLRQIARQAADKRTREAATAPPGKRDARTSDALSAAAEADAMTVPALPRLLADDITPEAIASLLADNGGRLGVVSAEGGIFEIMAGRYSKGVANLDVFLKGHSGDRLKVDRKGRPPEYIARPAVSMLLSVQPAVLRAIERNREFRGRGLLARVLYSLPDSNIGYRRTGSAPVPEPVADAYAAKVRTLALDLAEWTDPAVLVLSPDARRYLLDVETAIEPRLRPEGDLGAVVDWAAKHVGAVLRMAALLHLAGVADPLRTPVGVDTLAAAARLGEYFTEHARAAFGLLGATGTSDAAYLLTYLHDHGREQFSTRELHAALPRGRFARVDDVQAAVDILEAHGWVARLPAPERKGPGRPPSPGYLTHPEVSTESAKYTE